MTRGTSVGEDVMEMNAADCAHEGCQWQWWHRHPLSNSAPEHETALKKCCRRLIGEVVNHGEDPY